MRPLEGIRVLDFSILPAGAVTALILAEAGAEVIRVEPNNNPDAAATENALVNRGKKRLAVDPGRGDLITHLGKLIESADVVVLCDRPGESRIFNLEVGQIADLNAKAICCEIIGWDRDGPMAELAGEDFNYLAESGLFDQMRAPDTFPSPPPPNLASLAAGALPAAINILLALRGRDSGGDGRALEIAISDNLFGFQYQAIAAAGHTGSAKTPRYGVYETSDGRYIAVAAVEDRYWENLCERLELDDELREASADPAEVQRALTAIFKARTAKFWRDKFENRDLCCSIVASLDEALAHPQFRDRAMFDHQVTVGGRALPAVVVPVDTAFRDRNADFESSVADTPDAFL